MPYEEAIQELEWIYQNGFENDIKIIGTDRILDAIRMGIEALDKQIPKKPIHPYIKYRFIISGLCPACGYEVEHEEHGYCWFCGQALDWSEE